MKTPWIVLIAAVCLVLGFILGAHHARKAMGHYVYGTLANTPYRTDMATGATELSMNGKWVPYIQNPVELQK